MIKSQKAKQPYAIAVNLPRGFPCPRARLRAPHHVVASTPLPRSIPGRREEEGEALPQMNDGQLLVAEQGFSCLLLSAQLLATVVFLQFCRSMNPAQ
jgi:hypothetical protein